MNRPFEPRGGEPQSPAGAGAATPSAQTPPAGSAPGVVPSEAATRRPEDGSAAQTNTSGESAEERATTVRVGPERAGIDAGGETVLAGVPAVSRAMAPSPPRSRIGPYEVLEELGYGASGVVYLARQVDLDRTVALKVLRREGGEDAERIQRFLREAQSAARLQHPNIVPIHEVGREEDLYYYSMEFVRGMTLERLCAGGPATPRRALQIVLEVARALEYSHAQGIIHRDLKPQNILIPEDGRPRVTDFGLARDLHRDSALTQEGTMLGTPSYMPPEQALGRLTSIDERSDVYSLGAVLYFLLAGRPPFEGITPFEVVTRVLHDPPLPLRQWVPAVHPDIETISFKCMEKEPERRYPTMTALVTEVERFLDGLPISARPPSLSERVLRTARRHRIATFASLIAVFAVSASVLWSAWVSLEHEERGRREQVLFQQATRIFQVLLDQQAACEREAPERFAACASRVRDELQEVLSLRPDYREARLRRADLSRTLGQLDAAARDYDALMVLDPDSVELMYRYQALGDAALDDGLADTHRGLVETAQRLARTLQTLESGDYGRASRLRLALRQGDIAAALSLSRDLMTRHGDRPEILTLHAEALLAAGGTSLLEALSAADAALQARPRAQVQYRLRGRILLSLRRVEEAIADFWTCVRLRPEPLRVDLERLCRAYRSSHDPGETGYRAALERLVSVHPQAASGWTWLARLELDRGDLDRAAIAVERAHALTPGDPAVWAERIRLEVHRAGVPAAVEILLERIERADRNWIADASVESLARLSRGLIEAGLRPRAAEVAAEIARKRPEEAELRAADAFAALAIGNTRQALAAFDAALALRASEPGWLRGRARALFWLERADEGLDSLVSAVGLDPGDAEALLELALLHEYRGREEAASESLRAAALAVPLRRLGDRWRSWREGATSSSIPEPSSQDARDRRMALFASVSPRAARSLCDEGSRALRAGLDARAEACFGAATVVEPDNPEVYLGLTRAHSRRGAWIPAILALERALDLGVSGRESLAEDPDLRALMEFPRVREALEPR